MREWGNPEGECVHMRVPWKAAVTVAWIVIMKWNWFPAS